jgi:thioester reductase-like protein
MPSLLRDLTQMTMPSGDEGRKLLEQFVQAMAAGVCMDWDRWHQGVTWRWVQSPGHPFLRSRFWWMPRQQAEPDAKASLWLDHLGVLHSESRTERAAPSRLQRLDLPGVAEHWQLTLDPAVVPDLKEHALCGQPLFAAAGYLAVLLDWLQECQRPLQLGALQLERPLWLHAGAVRLQAVVEGDQLCLHSRASDAEDASAWQTHGQVQLVGGAVPWEALPPLPQDDGLVVVEANALYDALQRLGLDYGRMYRPICVLQANPHGAVAVLHRPEAAPDRCLIDGCFQLVAAVLAQRDGAGPLLLPVGVEAVQLQRWPLPDRFRCVLRLRPQAIAQQREGAGHVWADLDLVDLEGAPIGWLRGLQLRRLTRTLLELMLPVAPPGPSIRLLEEGWQPLSSAAFTAWSPDTTEAVSLIVVGDLPALVQSWCEQQAVVPVRFNVDEDPTQLLPALVNQLRGWSLVQPRHLLVVLPAAPHPAVGALQAAVRSVAQDCPAWRCSTLTLAGEEPLTAAQWQALLAATAGDAELRWCGDDRIESRRFVSIERDRLRLLSDGSGRLEGLVQVPLPMVDLQPGELELAVEATGLNFRDVLNALGMLQSHNQSLGLRADAQLPFGGEAVGRVVAVGPGVDSALVGTRMLAALTLGSLASHVTCRAALCVPWPEAMPAELGASLSTAYLTAEYGLEHLAQLQAGEIVMIHAAAGGVGQAAVQVALRRGARILATASAAKQAALLEQGVEAVFDSRTTAFAEQVLAHTKGEGVQVVLNSLKGEWVDASFRALARGGRFVELGKLEIWNDQQVHERRPDVRYHRFDLLEVAARDPQPLRERLVALVDAAQAQRLPLLPITVFPFDQVKDAFLRMAQGRHVGKQVITLPEQAPPQAIRGDGTYLILGAFGGIGQRLQHWLVKQGARSLLLVGRQHPQADSAAAQQVEAWQAQGIEVVALGWDGIDKALAALPADRPLRGVIHAAGVLRDQPIGAIETDDLAPVLQAKWGVEQQLAQLRQRSPECWHHLDFQVVFSSIAAGLGSPGQVAYAAANGALEASCWSAPSEGPMQLAIQWGPWAGAGMAAGLDRRLDAVGLIPLEESEAFAVLEQLLQRGRSGVVMAVAADWPRFVGQAMPRQAGWFQALLPEASGRSQAQVRAQLQALPPSQRRPWLLDTLQRLLAEVMEQPDEPLDVEASLFDLGLDSLMAAEFAAVVQESLGWRLDLALLSDAPCLDDLATLALQALLPDDQVSVQMGLDLAQESQLPEGWCLPPSAALEAPGDRVLLTGASGFLGAYLLAGQLACWPELRVRCLVRAASRERGLERLEDNLRRYGLWQPEWSQRLEVSLGDLAQPQLGLDDDQFQALGDGVTGILHNGAQLSQMASYAQLASANVGGTRELLRLAVADAPLRFELISSVAVFEADAYRDQTIEEHDALEAWQGIHLGYSQTKWVTDRMVRRAADQGLPVVVYRPPLIAGPSCGSAWHQGDLLQRLLQGCLALGAAPDLAWELDVVPVDYVADAVTALAWSEAGTGRCFHLQHPEPLLLTTLLGELTDADRGLRLVPMQDWIEAIAKHPANPLHPLLPFFQQGWGDDGLTYPERNCHGQRARPSCLETTHQLAELGVRCPGWDQLIGPWAAVLLQQPTAAL